MKITVKELRESIRRSLQLYLLETPLEDEEVKIAPSVNRKDIPPHEVFVKHYGNTKLRYNLIYANLDPYRAESESYKIITKNWPPIDDINNCIQQIERNIAGELGKGHRMSQDEISTFEYVKNHLKSSCINVIMITDNPDNIGLDFDLTPEAIDHDIAHRLLDLVKHVKNVGNRPQIRANLDSILPGYADGMPSAFLQDFEIYVTESDEQGRIKRTPLRQITKLSEQDIKNLLFEKIEDCFETMLALHLNLPESISMKNIAKNIFRDLLYDTLAAYNARGENLDDISIKASDFDMTKPPFVSSSDWDWYCTRLGINCTKFTSLAFVLKDDDLSHTNQLMQKFTTALATWYGEQLKNFVGKVIVLGTL